MPEGSSKRLERLQIMLTDDELRALDDWRFKLRMPSRSAAVRELLRRGLAAEGYYTQAESGSPSSDFGILDDTSLRSDPDQHD
ncbi:hypothetical protein GCM10011360_24470 [Primorskyibacter flagellatus]|uniref:Uncharacterized protein n=1 Tax=Primorskyibacter flagellatus TaxID=1387277 RepID=A0A917EH52_9RHOB|nr:hypothetical protein [Primorskyibacter flagellatus]GGE35726.1 hypothetical protein GCM10011360_24470 [Primorskyibacter flagellatus]